VRVGEADLRDIKEHGASIAHCPVANARLGHGIAPIVEALELGIAVGIGTDSVASNNRLDLLEEAHLAQAMQRARLQSVGPLPSDQLLQLTTIEGARILGMADEIGSLVAGKAADFCVLDLSSPNAVPVTNPVSALFHAARGSDVVMTVVAGQVLYEDGSFHTLDENALREQVQDIAGRLCNVKDAL
jgi:5-methylthioadenosine/S-adenosylhomocysteine deaminase